MSKHSRSKGKRGERKAKELLADRDWTIIADTACGLEAEDIIAETPQGTMYSIEVKNRKAIDVGVFKKQAIRNAAKIKKPWMLMCKIDGTSSWLICQQGEKPTVWHEKKGET